MALPDISLSLEPGPKPEPVGVGGPTTTVIDPVRLPALLASRPAELPGFADAWIEASTQLWLGTLEMAMAFGRMLFGDLAGPPVARLKAARDEHESAPPWRRSRPRSALVRLKRPPA